MLTPQLLNGTGGTVHTVAVGFQTVNRLKSSGKYVYHVLEHGGTLNFATKCIYVVCMELGTNSDYFTVQHQVVGFHNRDGVCLLRGTFCILRSARTVYLCVLYGSENKQRLFHCTALTDWFL